MADAASARSIVSAVPTATTSSRHTAIVRVTHWITTLCFFALLVTGVEIIISHPRFYWGETGNIFTPSLFDLPIPASRSSVPTGYGFVLPDQNGWSRSLHFQSAWLVVFTGFVYAVSGLVTRHFRKNLIPTASDLNWNSLSRVIANHLHFKRPDPAEAESYNALQRLAYILVIIIAFPFMIWTGLAMSPAIASAFPASVTVFGGQQSARTLHFFGFVFLLIFLIVHIAMVCRAGFQARTRAMITGRAAAHKEQP